MLSEAAGSMRRFTQALIGTVLASVAGCASTGALAVRAADPSPSCRWP
jgi:hypothetical protein